MKMVALLRGINVGGNRKVPMPELQKIASKAGFTEIETYINSGNLVFDAHKLDTEKVALVLEKAIQEKFGFEIDVIVRTSSQWKKIVAGNPFLKIAADRPHLLHLGLTRKKCEKNANALLTEKAHPKEKFEIVNGSIWVDFANGSGKSKLTPAVFDKAAGSTVTMRNWNTVLKIAEMLGC